MERSRRNFNKLRNKLQRPNSLHAKLHVSSFSYCILRVNYIANLTSIQFLCRTTPSFSHVYSSLTSLSYILHRLFFIAHTLGKIKSNELPNLIAKTDLAHCANGDDGLSSWFGGLGGGLASTKT
jgi:hypothetical protein